MKKLSQKKLQFYKIMVSVLFFTFSSLSAGIVYIPPGPDAEAKYLKRIKTRYLEIERADAGLAELPSTPGRFTQLLDQFQAYLVFTSPLGPFPDSIPIIFLIYVHLTTRYSAGFQLRSSS